MLLLKTLSRLPLGQLYFISSLIYFFLFHILRYRRKTSYDNIRRCFPNKSAKQIRRIQKQAYRYLSDTFFESVKARTLSAEEIRARFILENYQPVESFLNRGKSVLILTAHTGPPEWAAFALQLKLNCLVDPVYKPIHSKKLDRFVFAVRSRFHSTPIPYKHLARDIVQRKNITRCVAMLADLEPRSRDQALEINFLNRPTRFFTGSERIARLADMPVFFARMEKTRRGHYCCQLERLCPCCRTLEPGALIKMYAESVQSLIEKHPPAWLWTHRRWKHAETDTLDSRA